MSVLKAQLVPSPDDGVRTSTSVTQAQTEIELSTLIEQWQARPEFDPSSPPPLDKNAHLQYLAKNLFKLPAPFVSLDASRPWMLYWMLHCFDLLGVSLDQDTKSRGIATILSFQSPTGGFGGGVGQLPNLLPTYASVCSLAILEGGWDAIDREGIYRFFMSMKKRDGAFSVCEGGEVDVRGAYCLLAVATMLDLLTPELVQNTEAFFASCQTYEGGFAASSSSISSTFASRFLPTPPPSSAPLPTPTPLGEAHGGYTSCAVLGLHLLEPTITSPPTSSPVASSSSQLPFSERPFDIKALLRWTVTMQASAADGGGFKGRTNKLVDGCYGWWVGGSLTVLEEMSKLRLGTKQEQVMLYDRVALQEFVLLLAQHPNGGLRDKPPKKADFYHTANNLSGLSLAQHKLSLSSSKRDKLVAAWRPTPSSFTPVPGQTDEARKRAFVHALAWEEAEQDFLAAGGEGNRVNTTHPSLNILCLRVEPFMRHFYGQSDPSSTAPQTPSTST